ncbi:hypothetical protein TUM17563_33720 [Klebsiella oxytoca]|nr:hypothetical protein TUM17563_33720 [Klebsiella oxytoca]
MTLAIFTTPTNGFFIYNDNFPFAPVAYPLPSGLLAHIEVDLLETFTHGVGSYAPTAPPTKTEVDTSK